MTLRFKGYMIALLLVAPVLVDGASEWPAWRGPNLNGLVPDANPPIEWSETSNIRWKSEIPGLGLATPVVWGYVDVSVRADGVPLKQEFFSEKGKKVRTMTYSEIKEVSGIKVPHKMVIKPEDKPNEFTEMVFHTMELDIAVDESLFSLQSLRD